MKKTMRKIVPAVLMLLISAMLVGTSTYAWFAMNNKVTVTGMTVNVQVKDNILISKTNSDNTFTGGIQFADRNALLAPVSTVDGVAFYYANSQTAVAGNGESKAVGDNTKTFTAYSESTALANDNAGKSNYDNGFQAQAGVIGAITDSNVAYGYLEYAFYIKATNAAATQSNLNMTVCNLLYNGSPLVTTTGKEDRAWRVAVFVQDATKDTALDTAVAAGDLKTILAPASAAYFVTGKAAASTSALGSVSNFSSAATLKAIAASTTVYEKVTIRLWMEGEDNTCKNETYAAMTGNWALDLAFEIQNGAGTAAIQSTPITTSTSGLTGSITLTDTKLSNGETPSSYAWKDASDDSAATGTGNNTASFTADGSGDYYCLITTTDGNVYRTANLHLAS